MKLNVLLSLLCFVFFFQIEKPLDRLSLREPADRKYDAFLFYDDESRNIGTKICNYLEKKGTKLFIEDQRAGQKAISDLDYVIRNCYWTIVILTRKSLKDGKFTLQLFSLLQAFLVEKKIRLIPVLLNTSYGDIPDAIRVVTYVGVDENERYLERLYCTLKGTLFNLRFCVTIAHLNDHRIIRSWEIYIKCTFTYKMRCKIS